MLLRLRFYTILSLAPLLVITVSIGGQVYRRRRSTGVSWAGSRSRPDSLQRPISMMWSSMQGDLQHSRLATGLSVLILIWGGSAMFSQLQTSINEMWGVSPNPEAFRHSVHAMVRSRLVSAVLVVAIGYLVLAALTLSTMMAMIPVRWMGRFADTVAGMGAIRAHMVFAFGVHVAVCVDVQGSAEGKDTLARRVGGRWAHGVAVLGRQQVYHSTV